MLGSVGLGVAARAEVPVIVVRGEADRPETGSVTAAVHGPEDLDWLLIAAAEADARKAALRVVSLWNILTHVGSVATMIGDGVDPRELSVPALVWAADEAARRGARLRLVGAVPPVHDRLSYAADARRSSLRIRAKSALVVAIREPEHTAVHPPLIVVGVDGRADCRAAVSFVVAEESPREARLLVLWAWPRTLMSRGDEIAELASRRRLLAEAVAGHADRYPDVVVERAVVRGHPVGELARASREALAVVVGRRGRGGRSGMRLGATVHGPLHRADCPVITVPWPPWGGADGTSAGADRPRPATDRPAPPY